MTRKNGVSAAELERILGVTYETAWQLLHKIRATLCGDPGAISSLAEIAQMFLDVRPPRGEPASKTPWRPRTVPLIVGIGLEGAFVTVPHARRNDDLIREVGARVSGAVLTNGRLFHALTQFQPIEACPLAAVRVFRGVRRMILGTHRSVSKSWLGRYLSEFMYRANRAPRADDFVQQALSGRWSPFSVRPLVTLVA